jgi:DNA-binding NarL/FixJ family response regulator
MAEPPGPWQTGRYRVTGGSIRPGVVVVEDHDAVRRGLALLLADAGLHVPAAVGTLAEGRRAVRRERPAVVVVDDALPDGSGMELCREVAVLSPGTVAILHAATLLPGQDTAARAAGAAAVVLKSVDGAALLGAIERCTAAA